MVDLSRYITSRAIVEVVLGDHEGILRQLVDHCLPDFRPDSRAAVTRDILDKGRRQEINLGEGFALSHARLDDLPDIRVAVGLLRAPTRYVSGPAVRTIFCVILPTSQSRQYLQMMARLTRLISRPEAAEAFRSGDVEKVSDFFRRHSG